MRRSLIGIPVLQGGEDVKLQPSTQQLTAEISDTWGFAQLLEHIDIGILVLDLQEQRIDYCNAAFFEMLQDDRLCRNYRRLYDLFLARIEEGSELEQSGRIAQQVMHQGRLFGHSVYQAGPRYRCIFLRDITEKSRLESIAQAVNTMDNIGFIFSGIRHEIGNPLNSLKMALSVLKDSSEPPSAEMLDAYLERSLTDIGRIEYMLRSLKTFTMHERIELKDCSLVAFMDRFISLVERDFHSSGIRIRTEIPLTLPEVRIDERALQQALLNLFSNAADALEDQPAPEIRLRTEVHDPLIRLSVSDNGRGISTEQQKYLFQPFNTSKPDGNGLGLVITRKLLAMMNSDIELSSRAGAGTTATIRLPMARPNAPGSDR